jgi:hypothetical protein
MSTFEPDHNGECPHCDEWWNAHSEPDGACPTDPAQASENVRLHAEERARQDPASWSPDAIRRFGEFIALVEAAEARQKDPGTRPHYRCPRCGVVSFNPNDIANRYCVRCHQFEEPERP